MERERERGEGERESTSSAVAGLRLHECSLHLDWRLPIAEMVQRQRPPPKQTYSRAGKACSSRQRWQQPSCLPLAPLALRRLAALLPIVLTTVPLPPRQARAESRRSSYRARTHAYAGRRAAGRLFVEVIGERGETQLRYIIPWDRQESTKAVVGEEEVWSFVNQVWHLPWQPTQHRRAAFDSRNGQQLHQHAREGLRDVPLVPFAQMQWRPPTR
eukprot:2753159-Pleurochrysis_carterae.AAC.3